MHLAGLQVFGITEEDHSIVFRTGVAGASDPSGKTWKPVTAVPVRMRTFSTSSSVSAASASSSMQHPRTPPVHARRGQLTERSGGTGSPNANKRPPSQDRRSSRGSPTPPASSGQKVAAAKIVEGTSNDRFKVRMFFV